MIIYLAVLYCMDVAACNPGSNSQFRQKFETEEACTKFGVEFLQTQAAPMFKNYGITCVKVVR